jgi:hypothetical protein
VLHNDTSYNGGTGISLFEGESPIYAPAYLIGGNEADHNRGAGIAVCVRLAAAGGCAGGMHDLGGNTALGNAPQRDCVNIRCRRASRAILS